MTTPAPVHLPPGQSRSATHVLTAPDRLRNLFQAIANVRALPIVLDPFEAVLGDLTVVAIHGLRRNSDGPPERLAMIGAGIRAC